MCWCALQSTLMRAISNGQVDGFPPPEELRTVYVEHDIDASESEQAVLEFIHNDPILQGAPCSAAPGACFKKLWLHESIAAAPSSARPASVVSSCAVSLPCLTADLP